MKNLYYISIHYNFTNKKKKKFFFINLLLNYLIINTYFLL